MTRLASRWAVLAIIPVAVDVFGLGLAAQAPGAPRYRPSDAALRATRMVDSTARLDRSAGAVRRVMVDTLSGGAFWLEFEPAAFVRVLRASTPEAAGATFLDNYGSKVLGIIAPETALRIVKTRTTGDITHLRYEQISGGYRVLGAQLALHLARISGEYTVQSVNGWLVPGVAARIPRIGRSDAEVAALSVGRGRIAKAEWDATPVHVPYEEGTRLGFLVPVVDSTSGEVIRYVDAETGIVFAQTRAADDNFAPLVRRSMAMQPLTRSGVPRRNRPRESSMGYHTTVVGMDWKQNVRQFVAWYNLSTYEMRDNSHAGTNEVVILNHAGVSPYSGSCDPDTRPIVARPSDQWPAGDSLAREEVSAIYNLGQSVTHFKTKFGRDGMHNLPNWNTWGCVHTPETFQGTYSRSELTIRFSVAEPVNGPSAAAEDLVTHEFTHGISHYEVPSGGFVDYLTSFETAALNEALSDYFGARHSGYTCQAQSVVVTVACDELKGFPRQINSAKTRSERENGCDAPNAATYHCVGVVISSALWASTQTLPPAGGEETDWATYNGLRDYMTPVTPFVFAREAIVRAAKDRERYLPIQSLYPIAHELETQFYNRGIGPSPVTASVAEATCGQWVLSASASGTFSLAFQSGTGLYPDGGVLNPTCSDPRFMRHSGV